MAHRNESWHIEMSHGREMLEIAFLRSWETLAFLRSSFQVSDMTFCHFNPLHTATHCNTLQHNATHCITLQHTAAHCNTVQHTAYEWVAQVFHDSFLCAMTKRSTHNEIKYQRSSVPWLISMFHDSFLCVVCCSVVQCVAVCCSVLQYIMGWNEVSCW